VLTELLHERLKVSDADRTGDVGGGGDQVLPRDIGRIGIVIVGQARHAVVDELVDGSGRRTAGAAGFGLRRRGRGAGERGRGRRCAGRRGGGLRERGRRDQGGAQKKSSGCVRRQGEKAAAAIHHRRHSSGRGEE